MTISENAKKTAQWWTNQLRSSSVKLDNGVPDHANLYAAIAMLGAKDGRYSEEQLKRFESCLAQRIERDSSNSAYPECFIAVDYDPDDTLCEVAKLAGIKLGKMDLPWKTWTRTCEDRVILSHGYAAPQVEI